MSNQTPEDGKRTNSPYIFYNSRKRHCFTQYWHSGSSLLQYPMSIYWIIVRGSIFYLKYALPSNPFIEMIFEMYLGTSVRWKSVVPNAEKYSVWFSSLLQINFIILSLEKY
jgi:hypothetical protein